MFQNSRMSITTLPAAQQQQEQPFVPTKEALLKEITSLKAAAGDKNAQSTKVLTEVLKRTHPEWKINSKRIIRILQSQKKATTTYGDENASANTGILKAAKIFSPSTGSKASLADTPVDSKNILSTRLRPRPKALATLSSNSSNIMSDINDAAADEEEADDAEFIPHEDGAADGSSDSPVTWTRYITGTAATAVNKVKSIEESKLGTKYVSFIAGRFTPEKKKAPAAAVVEEVVDVEKEEEVKAAADAAVVMSASILSPSRIVTEEIRESSIVSIVSEADVSISLEEAAAAVLDVMPVDTITTPIEEQQRTTEIDEAVASKGCWAMFGFW
jgi:hypothetical protein